MRGIIDDIAELTEGKALRSYKYSYDSIRTPQPDYDEIPDDFVWQRRGETIEIKGWRLLEDVARRMSAQHSESDLKFFLDGSRRVCHVDDIVYNGRVFPVIAGQVGVACCRRDNKRLKKEEPVLSRIVVALPDWADRKGRNQGAFLNDLREQVNGRNRAKFQFQIDDFLLYSTAKDTREAKFEDKGIAKIQDYMIDREKELVDKLVKVGKLGNRAWLVKDGSLEYAPMRDGKYSNMSKILDNYRWVIGVSKSFNPELCRISVGKNKDKPYPEAIINMPPYSRTPVAKVMIERISHEISFAIWYVRIHKLKQMRSPYDGVVKVEKILVTDDEQKNGLSSDVVDNISAALISERNPSCYGSDLRYANHIYPIYLTEAYVKSLYLSTEVFMHRF